MYTKRIQLTNYGPIENLDIVCPFDGDNPKPIVLVGENGSGKSVLLSHIVNGLLLAQQLVYPQTPEVEEGRVYKLRSPLYIKSGCQFYFARVDFENNTHLAELQLAKQKQAYGEVPSGMLGTAAEGLWNQMSSVDTSVLSPTHSEERIREVVERNCMLYLPPNRFEEPAWLNEENLTAKARHRDLQLMQGHTDRQIMYRTRFLGHKFGLRGLA